MEMEINVKRMKGQATDWGKILANNNPIKRRYIQNT